MWSSMRFAVVVGMLTMASPAFASTEDNGGHGELGKFRVGHATVEIILTGALGEVRPIDVDIWYPAEKKNFEDSPLAIYTSRLHGVPLIPARWDPLLWKVMSKYAREGAEVAKNTRGFPVVVFSHGNANNPNDHHPAMEYIAANGFIVAAPWPLAHG